METTLYAFVVAIFIILICFIAIIIGLFRNWWRFMLFCAAAGVIGGVAGYYIPSNETNIMVAKIFDKEVMMEVSIEQVHMVIGGAIGSLVGMFSIVVQSIRKRYVSKYAAPNHAN
jgi:membrane protein YqaA with SNARE-associated domain